MSILPTMISLLAAMLAAGSIQGQPPEPTETLIERVAITSALAEAKLLGTGARIVISPSSVDPNDAPGTVPTASRSAERNSRLRGFLGAAMRPRTDVVACLGRKCEIRNADAFVAMSEPTITGDSAAITVTLERMGSKRLSYVTNRVYLERVNGVWQVKRTVQLGIS